MTTGQIRRSLTDKGVTIPEDADKDLLVKLWESANGVKAGEPQLNNAGTFTPLPVTAVEPPPLPPPPPPPEVTKVMSASASDSKLDNAGTSTPSPSSPGEPPMLPLPPPPPPVPPPPQAMKAAASSIEVSDEADDDEAKYDTADEADPPMAAPPSPSDEMPSWLASLGPLDAEAPHSPSLTSADWASAPVPLASLTEHDVVALLAALGLERYSEAVLAVPLRGADLVHCVEGDLETAGVSFRPHRLSMLELISHFNGEGVPTALLQNGAGGGSGGGSGGSGGGSGGSGGSGGGQTGGVEDDEHTGSGEMPAWLAQAQAQAAAEAADEADGAAEHEMPAWLSQAQAQLGQTETDLSDVPPTPATPALATPVGSTPLTSPPEPIPTVSVGEPTARRIVEDDDRVGPLLALGARALHASKYDGTGMGGSASGGTEVLSLPPHPGMAGGGGAKPDESSATLEIHFAEDRGSIRVIPGRCVGRLGAAPYLIGREGRGIDLALPFGHISAKQATILPPAARTDVTDAASSGASSGDTPASHRAVWRLFDTSTNGTLINANVVGKGCCIELHHGDRVHFGKVDSFPFAVFHLPGHSEAGGAGPSWRCSSWEGGTAGATSASALPAPIQLGPQPVGESMSPPPAPPRCRSSASRVLILDAVAELGQAVEARREEGCVVM